MVDGLHLLLSVIAVSQDAVANNDADALAGQTEQLREARAALVRAIDNTDVLLDMLGSVGL